MRSMQSFSPAPWGDNNIYTPVFIYIVSSNYQTKYHPIPDRLAECKFID